MRQIALDALPEAVVVVDLTGVVTEVNDRARVVLGLTSAAVGAPLEDVLQVLDDAGRALALPEVMVGQRLAERVVQITDERGHHRPVSLTGRRTSEGWVLTARPAGRREQLDRQRGDIVATVSHEIRSPLASVKGFTRTLLGRWDRFDSDQKRTMLEAIDADSDRVTRLLTELLEVSRIDAGRVQLRRETLELSELAENVATKAKHRDHGVGREVNVRANGVSTTVYADRDRVEQILTNLVDNALQYAPDSAVTVDVHRRDDGVEVAVSDAGEGVDAAFATRVFQKFGRGREERRPGTGLGLYIGRGLAQAHGGDLTLDRAGEGATFRLWLPDK